MKTPSTPLAGCLKSCPIPAGKKVSELLADVPQTFSTPEIRVECPDDKKFSVVKAVTEHFRKLYNIIDIDGVRILFDDGWELVRTSNTQPALVWKHQFNSRPVPPE